MLYLLKLRKILLLDYLYLIILFIVILISIYKINLPIKKIYISNNNYVITGEVISVKNIDNNTILKIKAKELLIARYKGNLSFEIGDRVKLSGLIIEPSKNTTRNLFNYNKYLKYKGIYHIFIIDKVIYIKGNINFFNKIKIFIINYLNKNKYLYTFILGDKSLLEKEVLLSYQNNGISHLFAISGMHIGLFSFIILKIFSGVKDDNKKYLITSLILILYLFLIGISPSVLRGVLFFIVFSYNDIYYFYIKPINLFILVLCITLLINPFFIFDISFQFSFIISFSLIIMSSYIESNNYFISLIKTSFISFLVSIPISLFYFYQINFTSIIYNIFYVPYVSFIIFPLAIISSIFSFVRPIFDFFTNIMEVSSLYLVNIRMGILIFPKINIIYYILYFFIIIIVLFKMYFNNYKYLIILIIFMIFHYFYFDIFNENYVKFIDIGQGDSILIRVNRKNILIDTGGRFSINNKYNLSNNITIPLFKSLGIRKLDYLLISHGDLDHIGESLNLFDKIKVDLIYINDGINNYYEKKLIEKGANNFKEGDFIAGDDFTIMQLNKKFIDENRSSSICLFNYKNINILFTGDADKISEKYILDNYDLPKIDILKVGHHGSRTSTSLGLINSLKPKMAIISAGINNKFGHPHKETINILNKYKVNYYSTQDYGTITFYLDKYILDSDK